VGIFVNDVGDHDSATQTGHCFSIELNRVAMFAGIAIKGFGGRGIFLHQHGIKQLLTTGLVDRPNVIRM
jgi:hypothetical protein